MAESLASVFAELDRYSTPIPLRELRRWADNCELTLDDLRPFMRFKPERYLRNLMWEGPSYQALVLCWRAGQRSPIHDHHGSACVVKVFHGTALETVFDSAPNGMIYAVSSRYLLAGGTVCSQDSDIHQMSNLQDRQDLVTLHLYSPPLISMNVYSLLEPSVNRFFDPINAEFAGGAGI